MAYQRRLLKYGPTPNQLAGSLSDQAIAGCWFELRRQGGCGAGELRLRDKFPDRESVQLGDWIACEYDVDDRWYLGRVVERTATSPAGVLLRLEGMASQLDHVFPGGYGSEADGIAPHRYGCTDLFPGDPNNLHVNIDCVSRPEDLVRLLLEQYVTASTDIQFDSTLIEEVTSAAEIAELKVYGTETATSLLKDLALRSRNASWGVDEYGRFYLLQKKEAVAAEWQEGRDLVSLREVANDALISNRVLLIGGLVYADCANPPCATYRWQGNYLQPESRDKYGERRIRLSLPWIRTSADSQAFVREFFRVYADPAPQQRVEIARQSTLIRPWLSSIRVRDRNGNELVTAQPEVIRVDFDHTPRFRLDLGPMDPRKLWSVVSTSEIWPMAPSEGGGFGGGEVDVTSDGAAASSSLSSGILSSSMGLSSDTSLDSTSGYLDCYGCESIARRWKVTFSGITSGDCPNCEALNGEWILERDFGFQGCVWVAEHPACGGPLYLNRLEFFRRTDLTLLKVIVHSATAVSYQLSSGSLFDCLGPNTLERAYLDETHCQTFPTTVVLEPV